MKIVLDTNVFISGVFWKGNPHKILNLWIDNKLEIIITEKILDEYIRVLEKIDQKSGISNKWRSLVLEKSIMVEGQNKIKICRDADDNKFLNAAVTGRVKYIISGDDDLLSLKSIESIKIITPSQFLKEIAN